MHPVDMLSGFVPIYGCGEYQGVKNLGHKITPVRRFISCPNFMDPQEISWILGTIANPL